MIMRWGVLTIYVDCRIGSLEMLTVLLKYLPDVDCRIGSLEKSCAMPGLRDIVDCRIGSLERKRRTG